MRVFIAIKLNKGTKLYIKSIADLTKEFYSDARYTYVSNYHITLQFIGEINPAWLPKLKSAVNDAANRINSFYLNISHTGYFKKGKKRILWVGLEKSDELVSLHKYVINALNKEGFDIERRPYKPHITIARDAQPNSGDKKLKLDKKEFIVNYITIMESKRINNRLTYIPLYELKLKEI